MAFRMPVGFLDQGRPMQLIVDMEFDGQIQAWKGTGKFRATSGLSGFQYPSNQCLPDKGPIPQGIYKVLLTDRGAARDDGTGYCNLQAGWGIQSIPRGSAAGQCEPYWANWGYNRVRLEPADVKTTKACTPSRGGFYIHDSSKGFSHGCIEVERRFFSTLRARATTNLTGYFLLHVRYVAGRVTNGGTRA